MSLVREKLMHIQLRGDRSFRWRGGDVSRIEGLSDAVFAFSITLLVVSLDVPQSFDELLRAMRGFFAFGLCFTLLIYIWYSHYIFFRRFGLEDAKTVALNGMLLFVVLFYIYPLKFLSGFLVQQMFGVQAAQDAVIREAQGPSLMIIYSSGFLAIFLVLALLNLHAYSKRDFLQLDPLEEFETRSSVYVNLLQAGIAAVSIAIAVWVPIESGGPFYSGIIYSLVGPLVGVYWALRERRGKSIRALPVVQARLNP